jgi:hypothetical protein
MIVCRPLVAAYGTKAHEVWVKILVGGINRHSETTACNSGRADMKLLLPG